MEQTQAHGSESADDNLASQVAQVILRSLAGRVGLGASGTLDTALSNYHLDSLAATRLVFELQCALAVAAPMEWLAGCGPVCHLPTRLVYQIPCRKKNPPSPRPQTSRPPRRHDA